MIRHMPRIGIQTITLCFFMLVTLFGHAPLHAKIVGVPQFDQIHDNAFAPWFEGVLTNLYDATHSYRLTYDDLENHANIHVGYYSADRTIYDMNADPDKLYGDAFSNEDYRAIIDGTHFCGPTAGAIVLAYWGENGYPQLLDTEVNMIGNLARYMGAGGLGETTDDGTLRLTPPHRVRGMHSYVDNAGYLADFDLSVYSFAYSDAGIDTTPEEVVESGYTWTFQTVCAKGYGDEGGAEIYRNEIDNNRPVIIVGARDLFGHGVVGIGYSDEWIYVLSYGELESYSWDCIAMIETVSFSTSSDPSILALPTNVAATLQGVRDVSLTWDTVPESTEYNVYRSTVGNENKFSKIAAVASPGYVDDTASESGASKLYYCIRALDTTNKVTSDFSGEVSVTIPTSSTGGSSGGCFINMALNR